MLQLDTMLQAGRKRRASYDDTEEEEELPKALAGQVLPVAELPDDFDGEAEDGATYLALAMRDNNRLPFVKRIDPPVVAAVAPRKPAAPASRHPVLPRESWIVVFAAHFTAYRASLAKRWPPEVDSVPVPPAWSWKLWLDYIDGKGGGAEAEADGPLEDEEDEEEAFNTGAADMEMDEDAVPREPLGSILSAMDTHTIMSVLGHLTKDLLFTTSLTAHRARWFFALLSVLDSHVSSDDTSTLRSLARDVATFVVDKYTAARIGGELAHVPVYPGFYSGDTTAEPIPVMGEVGRDAPPTGWTLGAARKRDSDAKPRSEAAARDSGTTSEDEIARAWMVAHAIVAGWAQYDLVDEFERMMRRLPLP